MSDSSEAALLTAARMCGLDELGSTAHRVHLFYVARHDVGSPAYLGELQADLRKGVKEGLWLQAEGRGRYSLTPVGRAAAAKVAPTVPQTYPALTTNEVRFEIQFAKIDGHRLLMRWERGGFTVLLDDELLTGNRAYEWVRGRRGFDLPPLKSGNHPGQLWDQSIGRDCTAIWRGPPPPPPPTTRYWALLANPKHYDVDAAVAKGGEDVWTLEKGSPAAGDRGLIWRTKGSGGSRGVIALFTVTAAPAMIEEPAEARALWRTPPPELVARRIRLRYDDKPGLPLWLDEHPKSLGSLSVSRGQGTRLYTVTPMQWKAVGALAAQGVGPDSDREPVADPEELDRRVSRVLARGRVQPPKGHEHPKRAGESNGKPRFMRDPMVKAYVLQQADGVCEGCGEPSRFDTNEGAPYLEVHHVRLLAEGGPDTPENTVAVCPWCHRRLHYARDRAKRREQIYGRVSRLVK